MNFNILLGRDLPLNKGIVYIFALIALQLNNFTIGRIGANISIRGIYFFKIFEDLMKIQVIGYSLHQRNAFSSISLLNSNMNDVLFRCK